MKADCHIHTLCSDGVYEVEEVVAMAVENGISTLAITDHDTISGIARARLCCRGRAAYITGTEITCAEHTFAGITEPLSIHLLGYGFDETDQSLLTLFSMRHLRTDAVYQELAEALSNFGCPAAIAEIPISCGSVLQLCDVADYITKTFAPVNEEAVRLVNSFAGRLTEANITIEEGITAIHRAGGKAVWAHPYHIYRLFKKRKLPEPEVSAVLRKLLALGIDGLETEYPAFSGCEKEYLNKLAAKYGLITTAGSDFHGDGVRNRMGMEVDQRSFFL